MPNQQSIIIPQAQSKPLDGRGLFMTVWYRFFSALAEEIPQIGDCFVQAAGAVSLDYLACDGSAISRATYAPLFAVIGIAYGPGDGLTTFNLPAFGSIGAPSFWKIRYQ